VNRNCYCQVRCNTTGSMQLSRSYQQGVSSMKGFFAYPSKQAPVVEAIKNSIDELKRFHAVHEIVDWAELDVPGRFISTSVLHGIANADFLIADITALNFNVTYEVGYAIGCGKRLVLVRNAAYAKAENETIKRVGIYDTIGYDEYENSRELSALVKKVRDLSPIIREYPIDHAQPIYVTKTKYQSDYAIRISARLKKSGLGYRSFDPTEQPRLSALDAISQVSRSAGVLVHFLPEAVDESFVHNLRCAFIAGLAEGAGRARLLLQEGEEPVPLDYRDLVSMITHPAQIDEAVADLAGEVVTALSGTEASAPKRGSSILERVHFGASSAENEIGDLAEYYLSTDGFRRALHGETRLIVGRKGSGKSAVFFRVRDKVSSSKRNVVLDLKPDGYQLVKLKDRVLSAMDRGTQEHTITAFWQCVLLLEIARATLQADKATYKLDDAIYKTYQQLEDKYKEYGYDSGQGDFAERISSLIYRIEERFQPDDAAGILTLSTPQVTELIYDKNISKVNLALAEHLRNKDNLWVLFDNIDKGWTPSGIDASDILTLRALLEASRKLERSLLAEGIDVHFLVFLRNDVYELLIDQTADRGKDQRVILDWRDREALKELVRLRVASALDSSDADFDKLWSNIAVRHVNGEDSFEFLVDRCLMRPRYLLDLLKYALGSALTLHHEKISDEDIKKAVSYFSTDIVQDTNLELRDVFPKYDGILYAFIGQKSSISQDDVKLALMMFKVEEADLSDVIRLLLWFGVLGVKNEDYESQYIFDRNYNVRAFDEYVRMRLSAGSALVVNPAFWDGLDIQVVT